MLTIILHSAECLHRADVSSLTDQTLFELVFAEVEDKKSFFDGSGECLELPEIKGVELDDEKCVVSIRLHQLGLGGTLRPQWLPQRLDRIDLFGNKSAGVIECARLPPVLRYASFGSNRLGGTLDLPSLPRQIVCFGASENEISGQLDFRNVPASLCLLYASSNKLERPRLTLLHSVKK